MHLSELINKLSNSKYKTYLEIGVDWGTTFNQIDIPEKVGVDPFLKIPASDLKGRFHNLLSDDYFAAHNEKFDCILIDGLHTYDQSKRDFINAWDRLNAGGIVVVDDCYPADELAALPDVNECLRRRAEIGTPEDMTWNGDVYKTILWLNDFTDYAYAYVKGTRGYVVVWQDTIKARSKLFQNENAIADCSFEHFKTLSLPTMTASQIAGKIRPMSLKSLLFQRG